MEYWDNKALYAEKHSKDNVCANCKYCYESSLFPQYENYKKCKIDEENISQPYKNSCPAFELK
jgi:hypothetical protein